MRKILLSTGFILIASPAFAFNLGKCPEAIDVFGYVLPVECSLVGDRIKGDHEADGPSSEASSGDNDNGHECEGRGRGREGRGRGRGRGRRG